MIPYLVHEHLQDTLIVALIGKEVVAFVNSLIRRRRADRAIKKLFGEYEENRKTVRRAYGLPEETAR